MTETLIVIFMGFVPELFLMLWSLVHTLRPQPVSLQGCVFEVSPFHQKSLLTVPGGTLCLTSPPQSLILAKLTVQKVINEDGKQADKADSIDFINLFN